MKQFEPIVGSPDPEQLKPRETFGQDAAEVNAELEEAKRNNEVPPIEPLEKKEEGGESFENPAPLELSSRIQLSVSSPPKMGKLSVVTGGSASPKRGVKRSPMRKRIEERPGYDIAHCLID